MSENPITSKNLHVSLFHCRLKQSPTQPHSGENLVIIIEVERIAECDLVAEQVECLPESSQQQQVSSLL